MYKRKDGINKRKEAIFSGNNQESEKVPLQRQGREKTMMSGVRLQPAWFHSAGKHQTTQRGRIPWLRGSWHFQRRERDAL